MRRVVSERAFGESLLTIPAALKSEKWQLITSDLSTPIKHEPSMPLTLLERRWLKAVSLDPRVRLFQVDLGPLNGVDPLFTPDMICYFDQYADGDDFEDEGYITRFRIILNAIKDRHPLRLKTVDRHGHQTVSNVMPEYLEYSEKDNKFRLLTSGCRHRKTVNLSRIIGCQYFLGEFHPDRSRHEAQKSSLTFTLFDGRNALERAMLHFAHFEKRVEKTDDRCYTVHLTYDREDETEMLIRILSFGPFIKVTEPQSFVELIKDRLKRQKNCDII